MHAPRIHFWRPAILVAALWTASLSFTRAHTLPISFLTLAPDTEYLHLELTFNPFELTFISELDDNHNRRIDGTEWEAHQAALCATLLEHLEITADDHVLRAEISGLTPDPDSHHATLRAHFRIEPAFQRLRLHSTLINLTSGSHLTQVTFAKGASSSRAQLDAQTSVAEFRNSPEGQPGPKQLGGTKPGWRWLFGAAFAVTMGALFLCAARILGLPLKPIPPADPSLSTLTKQS